MNAMLGLPLEAKVDMKDVGEAMFFVMVFILAFLFLIVWAKWKKRRRDRKSR